MAPPKEEKLSDILNSIRGIIERGPDGLNTQAPAADNHKDDSVLELTKLASSEEETVIITDPPSKEDNADKTAEATLLSKEVADKTKEELNKFASKLNDIRSQDNQLLDNTVSKLLKPMIKEWLDNNLPQLVEKIIAAELKKIINNS